LLEAMSCAVPVVVTDVGGNAELAKGCGVILDPRAIGKGLEEALRNLRRDPRERRAMGESARRRVKGHFSWDDNCNRLERIYDEVIAHHPSSIGEGFTPSRGRVL
jgi:glycosyltransferase involved in cell wall biosynthesis